MLNKRSTKIFPCLLKQQTRTVININYNARNCQKKERLYLKYLPSISANKNWCTRARLFAKLCYQLTIVRGLN